MLQVEHMHMDIDQVSASIPAIEKMMMHNATMARKNMLEELLFLHFHKDCSEC